MKFEEILKKYGKIPKRDAYISLNTLGNSLFKKYWEYTNANISETTYDRTEKSYQTYITRKWLEFGCDPGECNIAGYVLAKQHMYHEHRHIQMELEEWNRKCASPHLKSDRLTTDIIRRSFVEIFYANIYGYEYVRDPGEMDAEEIGTKDTVIDFNHDPNISSQTANAALFDSMMSENYGHDVELLQYSVKNIYDVIQAFNALKSVTLDGRYRMTPPEDGRYNKNVIPKDFDIMDEFLNSPEYEPFRVEFEKCKTGREMDKVLEQTIVARFKNIEMIAPRLHDELVACRKQMTRRIFVQKDSPIPIEKIRYNGMTAVSDADDFARAVQELSESQVSNLQM